MRSRASGTGFTLVEVLVALALVSVALLASASLFWQERAISSRLAAQTHALRAVEATLESLRAGELPLESRRHTAPWSAPPGSGIETLVLFVEVEPDRLPDLYRLAVEARYLRAGRQESRRVETLYWRTD